MTVEIVPLTEAAQGVAGWDELCRTAVEPNAFLDPRFLQPCVEHWPEARHVRLALVRDGADLVGVHAFTRAPVALRGVAPTAAATTGALMDAVIPIRRPLLAASDPVRAARALLRGLARRPLPGFAAMIDVPADGSVGEALRAAAEELRMPRHTLSRFTSAWTPRSGRPPAHPGEGAPAIIGRQEHLGRGRVKDILRRLRGLEREFGPVTITERGSDPSAIDDFLRLEAAGWKGDPRRCGAAYEVIGKGPWLRAVADRFRRAGDLSVFQVIAGDTRVYMSIALQSGHGTFAIRDCYEECAARYGPGNLGRAVETDLVLSRPGVEFFDPGMGHAQGPALSAYTEQKHYETYLLATRGAARKAALRGYAELSARTRAAAADEERDR